MLPKFLKIMIYDKMRHKKDQTVKSIRPVLQCMLHARYHVLCTETEIAGAVIGCDVNGPKAQYSKNSVFRKYANLSRYQSYGSPIPRQHKLISPTARCSEIVSTAT